MPLHNKRSPEFSKIAAESPRLDQGCSVISIDWQKLASVDLTDLTASKNRDPSVLLEHLSYIAMCDVQSELDLKKTTDQKTLLKLFKISQLLVLTTSRQQQNLERDLMKVKTDLLASVDKYTMCKNQLIQQVEEAKKMKTNNRNLRDTVKHINSVAISKGILHPLKCTECNKLFRDKKFLSSHKQRKHPQTIQFNSTERHVTNENNAMNHTQQVADITSARSEQTDDIELTFDILNANVKDRKISKPTEHTPVNPQRPPQWTSVHETEIDRDESEKTRRKETERKLTDLQQTCSDLENKMQGMMKSFKHQEQEWKTELEKNRNEYLVVQGEKLILEEKFRAQFEIMNAKVKTLEEQTESLKSNQARDKLKRFNSLEIQASTSNSYNTALQKQEKLNTIAMEDSEETKTAEVDTMAGIKAKIIAQRLLLGDTNEDSDNSDSVYNKEVALSSITEVSEETDKSYGTKEDSIRGIKSLTSDEETSAEDVADDKNLNPSKFNMKERDKGKDQLLARENKFIITEEKELPEKPSRRLWKDSLPNPLMSANESSEDELERQVIDNKVKISTMYGADYETEESSSSNAQSKENCQRNQYPLVRDESKIASEEDDFSDEVVEKKERDNLENRAIARSTRNVRETSNSDDDIKEDKPDEPRNTKLEDLLDTNPEIWAQLHEATEEVVNERLKELNVHEGADKTAMKRAMRELRSKRNVLARKYANFRKIRKKIQHEIKANVEIKMKESQVNDLTTPVKSRSKRKTFSLFKTASRSVKSKITRKPSYLKHLKHSTSKKKTDKSPENHEINNTDKTESNEQIENLSRKDDDSSEDSEQPEANKEKHQRQRKEESLSAEHHESDDNSESTDESNSNSPNVERRGYVAAVCDIPHKTMSVRSLLDRRASEEKETYNEQNTKKLPKTITDSSESIVKSFVKERRKSTEEQSYKHHEKIKNSSGHREISIANNGKEKSKDQDIDCVERMSVDEDRSTDDESNTQEETIEDVSEKNRVTSIPKPAVRRNLFGANKTFSAENHYQMPKKPNQYKNTEAANTNFGKNKISIRNKTRKHDDKVDGIDNLGYSGSGASEIGSRAENFDDSTEDESSVEGIDNLAYSHSGLESSLDDVHKVISDDDGSQDDDMQEVHVRPKTRVGNLFTDSKEPLEGIEESPLGYNADEFYSSYQEPLEYKPIKLKKPTGRKILELKSEIESQLRQRHKKKPAGAVNTVLQDADTSSDEEFGN